MDSSLISLVLAYIRDEWQAIPPRFVPPWGVWITQHAPLLANIHNPLLQPRTAQRAWFMRGDTFPPQPRNISEYARFFIMHFERPWDPYYLASADPRFRGRIYPLGMAAFAPFIDSQDVYLETLWGGLWGRGRRVRQTAPGVLTEVEFLWIS